MRQDYAEAAKLYRLAADQNNAKAQFNLGLMYTLGHGIPKDYAKAMKLYRLAADQGLTDAQYNLGIMYKDGDGVPKDYVSAYMWFNLSSAKGDPAATKLRDAVAEKMTPAQIAEAQKLAREWKPTTQSP